MKITAKEMDRFTQLRRKLNNRGLSFSEWDELIEFRKESLIEKGLNPDHYNLDDKFCSRKFGV